MNLGHRLAIVLLLLFAVAGTARPASPNVVILLADDMGYSDAGCYGGEIATPNLDRLAQGGLRFTQFYNTARCWPTRGALLTGYYAQQVRRDTVPGVTSGTLGRRPPWAPLLPELLLPLGYRSYHSGKWHLDGKPLESGFDHSYLLEDHDRHFTPRRHFEDDRPLPPVKAGEGYYTSTAIADYTIKFLKDHSAQHTNKPFFAYMAFTAPHFPLQAPAAMIAPYRENYRRGWNLVREERWEKIKRWNLGGRTLSPIEPDLGPPYAFPEALKNLGEAEVNRPVPWESLGPGQQEFQAAKMAVHAAMIEQMDREIGRVISQLRDMNALENTLVLFLSDNGASAEIMVRGDGHDGSAPAGSGATFLCLGPGWSTVANTPFRRHKTWVHEGGIATPLIAHWPKGIPARGQLRHTPGHVVDIVPTLLELAGAEWPQDWKGQPRPAAPGKNLAPVFWRDQRWKREPIWWLHEGNRALRSGDWKIVAAGQAAPWELYHLKHDRAETRNLAERYPGRVRSMAGEWRRQLERCGQMAREKPQD
jgi:arylsulfatase